MHHNYSGNQQNSMPLLQNDEEDKSGDIEDEGDQIGLVSANTY